MGRTCHNVKGHFLAAAGMMSEASPVLDELVLVAATLPMLPKEDVALRLLGLPKRLYRLSTIHHMVAFMTMVRASA